MPDNPQYTVHQERTVRRFDLRNLGSSILDALNFENGILHTFRSLLLKPGPSTIDYLQDGRLKYFSPFRLLVLSTAILLLLLQSADFTSNFEEGVQAGWENAADDRSDEKQEMGMKIAARVSGLIQEYFNFMIWFYIPVISFFSWLFNRKKGLNYAEHVVFNTYYTSVINAFSLIFILSYLFPNLQTVMFWVYSLFSLIYFLWYYRSLFEKKWLTSIAEATFITILAGVLYYFSLGIALGLALAKGWIPMT